MTKRLYLHLGAHKTGSTLLQRVLMNNKDVLSRQGYAYIEAPAYVRRSFFRHVLDHLHCKVADDANGVANETPTGEMKASFDGMIDEYGAQNIVVSNEDFLGRSNLAESGGLYPSHISIARFIRNFTQEFDTRIIYYVRRQDEMIESTYLQQIHQGRLIEFGEYIREIKLDKLCWSPIVDALSDVFGRENLMVRPFDLIRRGKSVFMEDFFSNFLGVAHINYDNTDFTNYSYSNKAIELARRCYPILNMEERKKLRNFLQRHFSNQTHEKAVFLSRQDRKQLMRRYDLDNETVIKRYMPDFDQDLFSSAKI